MAFCGSTTGGNILHSHPYVAPMMFWRNFQHWGQQYISSVIHIVDGIPTTTPTCIQVLRVFFLHKSFCLLDDQCAFTIALLGHLLSFKNGPHVSYKKNKWLSLCNVQLQRRIGTASGLCLDVFKVELTADAPPHTVHDSCQACSTGAGGETTWVTPEQRGDHAPRASRSGGNTLQGRL